MRIIITDEGAEHTKVETEGTNIINLFNAISALIGVAAKTSNTSCKAVVTLIMLALTNQKLDIELAKSEDKKG